jgi:hypothetical protein
VAYASDDRHSNVASLLSLCPLIGDASESATAFGPGTFAAPAAGGTLVTVAVTVADARRRQC